MDPEAFKRLYEGSFDDLPKSYNGLARLFGYPVYTSKWLPEEMIIMADRPYSKLTGSELSRVFAEQLQTGGSIQPPKHEPIEVTAFGDTDKSWLMGDGTVTTQNVETTFRVGADGRPEAVTRLVNKPSAGSAHNGGESELAWLKRRVDEICWRPT